MSPIVLLVLSFACARSTVAPVPEDSGVDADADGYTRDVDCDDLDGAVHPGMTSDGCDGVDSDCDGMVDEDPDLEWFVDEDEDGFGDAARGGAFACAAELGRAANARDCDDTRATVFPGAREACDTVDSDCDGLLDDGEGALGWTDRDGDGLGDEHAPTRACDAVDNALDCDDTDATLPWWLSATGSDRGDGSRARPVATLEGALARMSGPTRCVLLDTSGGASSRVSPVSAWTVGAGEHVDVRATGAYDLALWSAGAGPALTVLEGGSLRVEGVTFIGADAGTLRAVDGITRTVGGAILSDGGAVELVRTRFLHNHLGGTEPLGSDLALFGGTLAMTDVVFVGSTHAVYLQGVRVDGARVRTNLTDGAFAWWVRESSVDVSNLLFYQNEASGGAAVRASDSDVTFTNVTMADEGGAPFVSTGGRAVLTNVDIARNAGDPSFDGEGDGIRYGNLWPSPARRTACESCTYLDPRHTSATDYHPAPGSPLLDAGDPSLTDADGTRSDLGAYGGPGAW